MLIILLTILVILLLKIGMDTLFLTKIDAYNRTNKLYYLTITFIESSFGIFGLKIVLDLVGGNQFYIFAFALGAVLAGLISSKIKAKMDDKLEGQRKFFARITLEDHIDEIELVDVLRNHSFDFTVESMKYISGASRTVIQGSLENRVRMRELKDILRGRKGKHLVIMRAEDIYYLPK